MQINTLSNRQNLNFLHNSTEGNFNRVLNLLLLTNKEAAYRVMTQNKFVSETREFGKGLYFVESVEESETFDIEDRAVVLCEVFVGVSLVLTRPDQNIKDKFLKERNCDSVKGYLSLNQKYYVIYNYKKIKKVIALKANESIVRNSEISYKCTNHLCKFHGKIHEDACKLFCKVKSCKFFNGYHEPPCELKCEKVNCEDFNTFHKSDCRLRCTWENCIMFGKHHIQKCIHLDHEEKSLVTETVTYNKNKISDCFNKRSLKKSKKSSKQKREDQRNAKLELQRVNNPLVAEAKNETSGIKYNQEVQKEFNVMPKRYVQSSGYKYEAQPSRYLQEAASDYDRGLNRFCPVPKKSELRIQEQPYLGFNERLYQNPEPCSHLKQGSAKRVDLCFDKDVYTPLQAPARGRKIVLCIVPVMISALIVLGIIIKYKAR